MDFICEEDFDIQNDPIFGPQNTWYRAGPDNDGCDEMGRETASMVNQMTCQEAQARKSDLQLANKLDELADSLRSGTPPNFEVETTPCSPGQTLNEFLCVLESRLLEKTQLQEENCQTNVEPDYDNPFALKSAMKTPNVRMSRGNSPPRNITFSNVTKRPLGTTFNVPPPSPDWKTMLNDSNEMICYPSEGMYNKTAGDIWKRRAGEEAGCKCSSPPRSPVRQVQAIPVRCLPSPKFEDEDEILSLSDLRRPEYCGCTVDEILKKKNRKRTTFVDVSNPEDLPSWSRRRTDDSPFWKSKRSGANQSQRRNITTRKPCRSFVEDRDVNPDLSDSEEWLLDCLRSCNQKVTEDSPSKMGASSTYEDWVSKSRSNSSLCCCDDLPQKVAEWTEKQFGGQTNKGVNAGLNCRTLVDKKPLLKRKPTLRPKTLRESTFKSFASGLNQSSMSSPRSGCRRRITECLECNSPQVMSMMRERNTRTCSPNKSRRRSPRTQPNKRSGTPRQPSPMKLRVPAFSCRRMDDFEF